MPSPPDSLKDPINVPLLDLYSDYLMSSFSYTTATGLSTLLDHQISHDTITRFLSARVYTSKDLWKLVKPVVRSVETEDGNILFDDTIEEKPHTDENEIIAWHFDHSKGRNIKGINILSGLYRNENGTIPLAFELVKKDVEYVDEETQKKRRKASINKNEYFRNIFSTCIQNSVKFSRVLVDIWFSSKENTQFIVQNGKHFVFAVKKNRLVSLSLEDKQKGVFQNLESLTFQENEARSCFFKGLDFPVLVMQKVFTNEDGSTGILYVATSDTGLSGTDIFDVYQKRWSIEEYHQSIKSHTGLELSPTKTARTRGNHCFASLYAYFKLERLDRSRQLNHFALKSKPYFKALQASFQELRRLQAMQGVGA